MTKVECFWEDDVYDMRNKINKFVKDNNVEIISISQSCSFTGDCKALIVYKENI